MEVPIGVEIVAENWKKFTGVLILVLVEVPIGVARVWRVLTNKNKVLILVLVEVPIGDVLKNSSEWGFEES